MGIYVPPQSAWTTWSPTLTNITQGNGTVTAKYYQIGKTVHFKFMFTLGSTSVMGTSPSFSLPVASTTDLTQFAQSLGWANCWDTSASTDYLGTCIWLDANTARCYTLQGAGVSLAAASATVPMTWATGDILSALGTYEAA